ncbi:N-acetylmuramoyl-L-alanine amidase [Lysobacter koreensis]|uniref:N-acetylmuramoyl-L-alanine amidase n=1 Tax=Lysobacter koreensis TaxID=266122 RepID=A0ABW2YQS3_9GAMM
MSAKHIQVGQSTTTPVTQTQRKRVDVKVYVDNKGWVQNAGFVLRAVPELEKGSMTGPKAIVLHRTSGDSVESALASAKRGEGTHFYVDKDGTVYQAASLLKKTHHVGRIKSKCFADGSCPADEMRLIRSWGFAPGRIYSHEKAKAYPARYPMNEDSVGIETVASCLTNCQPNEPDNVTWDAPTPEQSAAISTVVGILKRHYGLGDADIYEHDKVSYKKGGEGAGLYSADSDSSRGFPPSFDQALPGHETLSQNPNRGGT